MKQASGHAKPAQGRTSPPNIMVRENGIRPGSRAAPMRRHEFNGAPPPTINGLAGAQAYLALAVSPVPGVSGKISPDNTVPIPLIPSEGARGGFGPEWVFSNWAGRNNNVVGASLSALSAGITGRKREHRPLSLFSTSNFATPQNYFMPAYWREFAPHRITGRRRRRGFSGGNAETRPGGYHETGRGTSMDRPSACNHRGRQRCNHRP